MIVCACAALYRAAWLSTQLSGFSAPEAALLLLADAPVLGVLAALAYVEAVAGGRWRTLPALLSAALLAVYLADVFAVLSLNARLQWSDVRMFGREWWLASSFVSLSSLAALAITAAAFAARPALQRTAIRPIPAVALLLAAVPFLVPERVVPTHLVKYTGSVLLLAREAWGSRRAPISRYGPADVAAYRREYDPLFEAPFARTRRNIVLVIVESLSSADSFRTSGLRNTRARFDALSEKGILFRNFFANYEASEGGIVALLSGVPPVHFPTASTNTFAEYAQQRAITASFNRSGYRCEFLTTVPMQFISMDSYARSPLVGFTHAAGQRETARFKDAPRFAFESPADRSLYEEVLARLDAGDAQQPALMALITASSHPPYVDPLGRGDTEEHAWDYVQEQLWWLHDRLEERGFFKNGVLVITGDHRRMTPVTQPERDRYGDSAKARIPLVIIGADVPRGVVDDRLFQQSDLLRMLDRAVRPGEPLSEYALWAERYAFVFGIASNASHLEVFLAADAGRRAFPLKLQGAEIQWLVRPPNALAIEHAIHRQRALQQAVRTARVTPIPIQYGRDLKPGAAPGVLVGVSRDEALGRDPDDLRGSLQLLSARSFDLDTVLPLAGGGAEPMTLTARAFLPIAQEGEYWFSIFADHASCLAIDRQVVLGCQAGLNEGVALLTPGVHRFDLRYMDRRAPRSLQVRWLPPGAKQFVPFPHELLVAPDAAAAR